MSRNARNCESAKKNRQWVSKNYKRCSPLSDEAEKNGESDKMVKLAKMENLAKISQGTGFGEHSN